MVRPTSRVSRVVVSGPLGPFADAYREKLEERGYSPLSAVTLQRQVAQMSCWLDSQGLGADQLSLDPPRQGRLGGVSSQRNAS